MTKKMIAIIFGGQSSEHEISCISATTVIQQVDKELYDVTLIGITKEGQWLKVDSVEQIENGRWVETKTEAVLLPDAVEKCILIHEGTSYTKVRVDIVYPVMHGLYGEDGTIQGLCEMAQIPYVGCGVLASAVGMDKVYTKIIVNHIGVRQADFELVTRPQIERDMTAVINRVEGHFSYPVFVKPSNAGSSKGVNKANSTEELIYALKEAAIHDRKILVEETIVGHEVECAVFGGGKVPVKASGVGEILAAKEAAFYDFEAKYYNHDSKTVVDPKLPGEAEKKIPEIAKRIFEAIDGFGLSRVDFFVTEEGEIVFNEINTMPGFTAISMYPTLWKAKGIETKQLVNDLIDLAFERA